MTTEASSPTTVQQRRPVDEIIRLMPKAELHVHLDGCLRIETIAQLASEQGLELPVGREELAGACIVPEDCPSLADYLDRYVIPLTVLQRPEALERAVYELCEDAGAENVRYIEPRFAPSLHIRQGMTIDDAIAAAARGWRAGSKEFGLEGGLILCAMRHRPPQQNVDVARAGEHYLGLGVVGFDIAGDEAPYPILEHKEALLYARAAGYGMTAHAGEGAGAQSVRDAVEVIGVSRIGHGTRSREDASLLPVLRDRRISLDMCPYSNLQTKSVASLESHPIRFYFDYSIPVTVSTDSRTCSNTSVSLEMERIHEALDFSIDELWQMTLTALDVGFAPDSARQELRQEFEVEMQELVPGISPA
ncbi:MAG TPA: adenosine deaminase [Chloroflexota bacterium]|nr:adenosine deaminase [Chloroflexota bacterium]